jgi:hypothetical protein
VTPPRDDKAEEDGDEYTEELDPLPERTRKRYGFPGFLLLVKIKKNLGGISAGTHEMGA